jgi:CubicO group peptidase (beta-lactamase class C family)
VKKPGGWGLLVGTIVAMAAWSALAFAGTIYGWWHRALAPSGDTRAFAEAVVGALDTKNRGNVVFTLIENGEPIREYAASIGAPVDRDTLFQVASLSKWITAWGVMTLVEAGKLDLDTPVSTYLTRWKLPDSEFGNDGVTVRRLLSHTAGLTDGLGYGGFPPGTPVQSLEDSLTHASDASPGRDGSVRVGVAPGTEWRYSGGGYTLLQLLIEEVTGEPFERYMKRAVFEPLGMNRSTFSVTDDTPNVATFYDLDGSEATHYRFTALAAASLYTTALDVTRFIQVHVASPSGEPPGRGVLTPATLEAMREPQASQLGIEIWGLGTVLYAPNGAGTFIIGHDGNNEPAINTAARLDPSTGDGIVVLETGTHLLASEIAGEWVFWKTGMLDVIAFTVAAGKMVWIVIGGWIAILIAVAVIVWRRRGAARAAATVGVHEGSDPS